MEIVHLDTESTAEDAQQTIPTELNIEDIPLLRDQPWLLGGKDSLAQKAALNQLKNLVIDKDRAGFYAKFALEG